MLITSRPLSSRPSFAVQRLLRGGATWLVAMVAAVTALVGTVAGTSRRRRPASRPFALAPGLCLPCGQACNLRLQAGDVLRVRVGRIWLTRAGDSRDHFLQPGTSFVASRREVVVIEGLDPAASTYEVERAGRSQTRG